jgi:hypothetical protein
MGRAVCEIDVAGDFALVALAGVSRAAGTVDESDDATWKPGTADESIGVAMGRAACEGFFAGDLRRVGFSWGRPAIGAMDSSIAAAPGREVCGTTFAGGLRRVGFASGAWAGNETSPSPGGRKDGCETSFAGDLRRAGLTSGGFASVAGNPETALSEGKG